MVPLNNCLQYFTAAHNIKNPYRGEYNNYEI